MTSYLEFQKSAAISISDIANTILHEMGNSRIGNTGKIEEPQTGYVWELLYKTDTWSEASTYDDWNPELFRILLSSYHYTFSDGMFYLTIVTPAGQEYFASGGMAATDTPNIFIPVSGLDDIQSIIAKIIS